MLNFVSFIGVIASSVFSIWAIFKYLILGTYKLDNESSKIIISLIEKESKFKWVLSSEYVNDPKFPNVYEAIVKLNNFYFFFSRSEKYLTAGWQSKEEISSIIFMRWNRDKILNLLKTGINPTIVPVRALTPYGSDRLGDLESNSNPDIYLDDFLYKDIEKDVISVLKGEKLKTSCLLHGKPGTGKTQFIKYLAKKYSLPINVIYLNPEYSNLDISRMFSSISPKSIVIFEDFDNYFDKRECIIKNDQVKFTFDAIINALDGVHNDYKQNIFIMTANDINKIDNSLKERPSRFKFVKEFGLPTAKVRKKILGDDRKVSLTEGLTLDQVFNYDS